eukprot:11062227-Alexandrium_andersonii.AAC.1
MGGVSARRSRDESENTCAHARQASTERELAGTLHANPTELDCNAAKDMWSELDSARFCVSARARASALA